MRNDRARAELTVFLAIVTLLSNSKLLSHFDRGHLKKPLGLLLQRQQGACFTLQPFVAGTRFSQKAVPLLWRPLQCCVQQLIELLRLFRVHRPSRRRVRDKARTWRCSSRASQ